jgi:hypothetical protein
MLYSEIIAVCSQIYTKHINTLCGQNAAFFKVKPGGTYSYRKALHGSIHMTWMHVTSKENPKTYISLPPRHLPVSTL